MKSSLRRSNPDRSAVAAFQTVGSATNDALRGQSALLPGLAFFAWGCFQICGRLGAIVVDDQVSTIPSVEPDAPRTLCPCGSARYSFERISNRREAVRLNSFAS